jgi:hypothetical protein
MCNTCNAYEAQSKLIDALIGKWFITNSTQKKAALDETKKKKILKRLERSSLINMSGNSKRPVYTCIKTSIEKQENDYYFTF